MIVRFAVALVVSIALGEGTRADEAAAWNALRAGGHVALMRHASAPGGAGDPPGFTLGDCATQRNLSDQGRASRPKASRSRRSYPRPGAAAWTRRS